VAGSVHGKAIARGKRDSATCVDCHSGHRIQGLKNRPSLEISRDVCGKCHASLRLNTRYKLPTDRVSTFFESYHGLAAQKGSTTVANCSSCHGAHSILPSADPDSTINANHLAATCGKCHPGATDNFSKAKVHADLTLNAQASGGDRVNWWVRRCYLILIFCVIGAMVFHNGLIFARKVAARARLQNRPVLRMDKPQRVQHAVLVICFAILAWTGFALKFPDSWIGHFIISNELTRSWTHRVAGLALLLSGLYHFGYVIGAREGRRFFRDMLPRAKDASDLAGTMGSLLGAKPKKPEIGRFGYVEKIEYWSVVWGTIIMGVTGLVIWFKMDVTRFLPRWAVDVAVTIHYYEAILACLAIIVWHFYHVIFDPDVYPLNWACWSGKVSKHWQEEEHPLDGTAETKCETSPAATAAAPGKAPATAKLPKA